jgi:hypothetical protein
MDDEKARVALMARAEELGYHVISAPGWGDVLWRHGKETTNPHTHSNWGVKELREMLDGIEWGREHGTAEP